MKLISWLCVYVCCGFSGGDGKSFYPVHSFYISRVTQSLLRWLKVLPFRLKAIKSSGHSHFDQEIAEKVFYCFRYCVLWWKDCFLLLKFKCVIIYFENIKALINCTHRFYIHLFIHSLFKEFCWMLCPGTILITRDKAVMKTDKTQSS